MSTPYIIMICLCSAVILIQITKMYLYPRGKRRGNQKEIDIGCSMTIGGREVQEDNLDTMTTEAGVLGVLSDGMGKAYGGRIASRIAVETFIELFKEYNAFDNPLYYFRKAFHSANREILKSLENERRGAASVGCVMIRDNYLYYAVVGNVKVCVYRKGDLVPMSTGHTVHALAEEYFKEGKISRQDALTLLDNHRLFNYIGQDGFRDIELFDTPVGLKKGDIVVVMSDGLYELLPFAEIEQNLSNRENCQTKAYQLMDAVNQYKEKEIEKDNASVILLGIEKGVRA